MMHSKSVGFFFVKRNYFDQRAIFRNEIREEIL